MVGRVESVGNQLKVSGDSDQLRPIIEYYLNILREGPGSPDPSPDDVISVMRERMSSGRQWQAVEVSK